MWIQGAPYPCCFAAAEPLSTSTDWRIYSRCLQIYHCWGDRLMLVPLSGKCTGRSIHSCCSCSFCWFAGVPLLHAWGRPSGRAWPFCWVQVASWGNLARRIPITMVLQWFGSSLPGCCYRQHKGRQVRSVLWKISSLLLQSHSHCNPQYSSTLLHRLTLKVPQWSPLIPLSILIFWKFLIILGRPDCASKCW